MTEYDKNIFQEGTMKRLRNKLLAAGMSLLTLSASVLSPRFFPLPEATTVSAEAYTYDADSIQIGGVTYSKKPDGRKEDGTKKWKSWGAGAVASEVTDKNITEIGIPEVLELRKGDGKIEKVNVTDIGDGFAQGLELLEKLTIPETITKIGTNVARDCKALDNIEFKSEKVETIDSSFLYNSKYRNNCYAECNATFVGEWMLSYHFHPFDDDIQTEVKIQSLLAEAKNSFNKIQKESPDYYKKYYEKSHETINRSKKIKKIARKAFSDCSPLLTKVNLEGITHINSSGLGEENYDYYHCLWTKGWQPNSPNGIKTLEGTQDIEVIDEDALYGTMYYHNLLALHKNDNCYFPMVLGKVLYKVLPGKTGETHFNSRKNTFIANEMEPVEYISCTFPAQFTAFTLPRHFKKFIMKDNIINLNKVTSLRYFREGSVQPVELNKVIYNCAYKGQPLQEDDIQFINNNLCHLTGGSITNTSLANRNKGYFYDWIVKPLAYQFLYYKCDIYPYPYAQNKKTDAWSQYNAVRKVACGIRDSIKYKFYEDGGSGNAATELVKCMIGIDKEERGIVCRDFADLFDLLMHELHIPVDKVWSNGHEWNIVGLRNPATNVLTWFNVDTCASWNTGTRTFMTTDTEIASVTCHDRGDFEFESDGITPQDKPKCETGRGDINGDNAIGIEDAQLIMSAYTDGLSGKPFSLNPYQKVLADVDSNGEVNSADATLIRSYYAEVVLQNNHSITLERYIQERGLKEPDEVGPDGKLLDRKFPHWTDVEKDKLKGLADKWNEETKEHTEHIITDAYV